VNGFLDFLDNELAFWRMQIGGVEAGARAADFLADLFQRLELGKVRVHLVGHSFGALVVANVVRHLALVPELRKKLERLQPVDPNGNPYPGDGKVNTLCLLQGALASAWFLHERELLNYLCGSLACIFSRYDTANGFYYPVSNHGRLAAGYVGLYKVAGMLPTPLPEPGRQEDVGVFTSLTEPPPLSHLLEGHKTVDPRVWLLNLDASRMIYEGPVLAGGGHGDIFKPDVLHLIWAVTRLLPPGSAAGRNGEAAGAASARGGTAAPAAALAEGQRGGTP
jgi:pimeloyl-ACP methyl ester carboxylesterase